MYKLQIIEHILHISHTLSWSSDAEIRGEHLSTALQAGPYSAIFSKKGTDCWETPADTNSLSVSVLLDLLRSGPSTYQLCDKKLKTMGPSASFHHVTL